MIATINSILIQKRDNDNVINLLDSFVEDLSFIQERKVNTVKNVSEKNTFVSEENKIIDNSSSSSKNFLKLFI
jgi:hypothetical protein